MRQFKILLLTSMLMLFTTYANAVNMAPIITYLLSDVEPGSNTPPVAYAGIGQNVARASTVTLNGTGSSDAEDDPLTYTWSIISKPAESNASLSDITAANPTFVADISGQYVIQLIVNDGTVNSLADTVTITASSLILPPTPPEI